MKKLIVLGDYCSDTLVCQEIRASVEGSLKDPTGVRISFIHSTPSTIHTAFLLNQLVITEERYGVPSETVFFVNTDPRLEKNTEIKEAEGSKGVIMKLASGLYITGPNAGYCFAMIKDKIEILYTYEPLVKGSQFRSRDNYPRVIAHLMDYLEQDLEMDTIDRANVPELRGFYVGHVDNYGNIKTTITKEDLKGKYELGDLVKPRINGIQKDARYVDNLFGGAVGELVMYPGSSGTPDNPFMEISAWSHFSNGPAGQVVKTGRDYFEGVQPGDPVLL